MVVNSYLVLGALYLSPKESEENFPKQAESQGFLVAVSQNFLVLLEYNHNAQDDMEKAVLSQPAAKLHVLPAVFRFISVYQYTLASMHIHTENGKHLRHRTLCHQWLIQGCEQSP